MWHDLYRKTLLGVADTPFIENVAKKQGMKIGVSRFVAGETLEAAIPALETLERNGLAINLDLLGEFIDTEAGAESMTQEIIQTLERLGQTKLERYMSVKPTQFGLGISKDLGLANAERILQKAKEVNAHVCFDMENYPYLEPTLWLYKTLREKGYGNVSTVLQSYLHRGMTDLKDLLELDPKPTLRIVKGAYRESPEVAYQDKAKVDANYKEMVYAGLNAGAKINIATHDENLISEIKAYLRGAKLNPESYEFQLLYGVKLGLQQTLAKEGHKVRIYVPYGKDWYGYFSRRLAERPANLMFVLKGLTG